MKKSSEVAGYAVTGTPVARPLTLLFSVTFFALSFGCIQCLHVARFHLNATCCLLFGLMMEGRSHRVISLFSREINSSGIPLRIPLRTRLRRCLGGDGCGSFRHQHRRRAVVVIYMARSFSSLPLILPPLSPPLTSYLPPPHRLTFLFFFPSVLSSSISCTFFFTPRSFRLRQPFPIPRRSPLLLLFLSVCTSFTFPCTFHSSLFPYLFCFFLFPPFRFPLSSFSPSLFPPSPLPHTFPPPPASPSPFQSRAACGCTEGIVPRERWKEEKIILLRIHDVSSWW